MEELTSENQAMCDQSKSDQISELTDPVALEAMSDAGLLQIKLNKYTSMKRQENFFCFIMLLIKFRCPYYFL